MGNLRYTGPLKIYFNRHGAYPLVWCVSNGDWELAVEVVVIETVAVTAYNKDKRSPDEEDGKPSAWIETTGELLVVSGTARITPHDECTACGGQQS